MMSLFAGYAGVRSVVWLILSGGFAGERLEYSYHHQEETRNSEGVYDNVVEDDRT
jgi:hypothetical protein